MTWVVLAGNLIVQIAIFADMFKVSCIEFDYFPHFISTLIIVFASDVSVVMMGLKTTMSDPSDDTVKLERYHKLT